MTVSTKPLDYSDRITGLEAGYKAMGREISGLREDFGNFASEIRRELHGINANKKTPWSAIIGACSFAVALLGGLITLGANGPLRELDRHDEVIESMRQNCFTKSDAMAMDLAMQREMRDLDQISSNRIDNLDTMLQREMRLLTFPIDERLKSFERRLDDHQKDGHPHGVEEIVRGIEKRVEILESAKK